MPDGCWLYRNLFGEWYITSEEPVADGLHNFAPTDPEPGRPVTTVSVSMLCLLHKQAFVPPPTYKIQVRHV